jgi:hypothetical protein
MSPGAAGNSARATCYLQTAADRNVAQTSACRVGTLQKPQAANAGIVGITN